MNVQSSLNASGSTGFKPSHEDISVRAADLWKSYGSPSDRDEEIWLEAERQLSAESARRAAQPSAPKNVTAVEPPRVETETAGTSTTTTANVRTGKPPGSSRRRS